MSKICTNCGNELKEGAKFCGFCGTKAEPVAEAPVQPVYAPPQQPAAPVYAQPSQPNTYTPEQPVQPMNFTPAGVQQAQPVNAAPQGGYAPPQQPVPQSGYTPQPAYAPAPAPAYPGYAPGPQPKKKKTGLIVGLIAGGAAVVIAAVVLLIIFIKPGGGPASTPEQAVGTYIDTLNNMINGSGDFDDMLECMYEWKYIKPENKSELDESIAEAKESAASGVAMLKAFYQNISITYQVKETKPMTKEEMAEYLKDNDLDEACDITPVEEMVTCTVTIHMQYGDETQDNDNDIVCIKADGKWYLSISGLDL